MVGFAEVLASDHIIPGWRGTGSCIDMFNICVVRRVGRSSVGNVIASHLGSPSFDSSADYPD